MSLGYLSLVITCALLGSATGRPRRHSKRILSSDESETRKFDRPWPPYIVRPPQDETQPEDAVKVKPLDSKIPGGKVKIETHPKVETHPTNIADKKPFHDDNKTSTEKEEHRPIPPKTILTKGNSEESRPVTERPIERLDSTTSEYHTLYTESTTPPWHKQFVELFDLKKEGVASNYNHIAGQGDIQIWELPRAHRLGTKPSEEATSTTPESSKCRCHFIEFDKLYNILVDADNQGYFSYNRRLELLQMGLYSNEQAKRCLHHCRLRTPSYSFSHTSHNMPTMDPARQNEIEIATESVDPDSLSIVRARQHCYQTLKSRNVTVNSGDLCYPYYKPTHDSPQPSTKPKGLHVWMCCKTITPRGYY